MKGIKRFVAIGAVALLGASMAVRAAADKSVKHEVRRISLRLQKADVSRVLPQFAHMMDARLDLQCARKADVTIDFSNLTVKTALSAICESAGLEWTLVTIPERVLRVTCAPEPPAPPQGAEKFAEMKVKKDVQKGPGGKTTTHVTLELKNANVEDVMKMAAQLTEAKLLLDTSLAGKTVTCSVKDQPLPVMLDTICGKIGAKWVLEPGTPPVLKVTKK